MSKTLQDPDLPAGAIVELFDDGGARRNDGVRLQAANDNPWYVMATIFGKQKEGEFDKELDAKNRRAWNGWFCVALTDAQRAEAMKTTELSEEELAPLDEAELAEIKRGFQARMGAEAVLPAAMMTPKFDNTYFPKSVFLEKYVFSKRIDCSSSHFADITSFHCACFLNGSFFRPTHFAKDADFGSVHSVGDSFFEGTHFGGNAFFDSARFFGGALFGSVKFAEGTSFRNAVFTEGSAFNYAIFDKDTDFSSACFATIANFSSATFKSKTKFDETQFKTHVPEFHAADLYDDTTFTLPEDPLENWPPLQGEGVMPAKDQKRAYNRMRLFMNKTQQIEEEQFFHRQEMRCKSKEAGWSHKPFYALFRCLSDYGNSVMRPLGCLVGLMGFVVLVTGFYLILTGQGNWGTATGWSIANTFPFFGFNRLYFGNAFAANLPWWLKTLGGLQTAFSFILLFLLGLGLRNRFRLR